jgi:RNase P/RNase MRP subunit p30
MKDIALPNNNEKELLAEAKELGVELMFVYSLKDFSPGKGLIIIVSKPNELNSARKKAKQALFVVASSTDEATIRVIIESKWIKYFTDIETSTGRDHTHYRRSNFNQVLAKLAKETGKTYVVDFSHILKVEGKQRELLLGRIKQNIKICNKYKVPVQIATFATNSYELRNSSDLKAFLRSLKK